MHYDCRAGLADTGPYRLPDGRQVIVRDHFLAEPGYPWAHIAAGLPYAVTEIMVFSPEVSITINDIQTTFASPSNYLEHLTDVAVLARDELETPIEDVRLLDRDEMARITERCEKAGLDMYRLLASKGRDELIRDGVMVYTREVIEPMARRLGVWDEFLADGFDELHPKTRELWPVLAEGKADQVLAGAFIMGRGFPAVS
jgi:hypothetical protein